MGIFKKEPKAPAPPEAATGSAGSSATPPCVSALQLASAGARMIPLPPKAKAAPPPGWPALATTDAKVIERWAKEQPDRNFAIVTGETADQDRHLYVLDVDGEQGRTTLRALETTHGAFPPTYTVTTGRAGGGTHHYFQVPPSSSPTIGAGKQGGLGEGLDFRCRGGYVVAAGSVHPSGARYVASGSLVLAELAVLPTWVLELLGRRSSPRVAQPAADFNKLLEGVVEGARNAALASLAGILFRQKGLPAAFSAALLNCVNEARFHPPLPAYEVEHTLASIASKEARRRVGEEALRRTINKRGRRG
jgi:hypothetical protein